MGKLPWPFSKVNLDGRATRQADLGEVREDIGAELQEGRRDRPAERDLASDEPRQDGTDAPPPFPLMKLLYCPKPPKMAVKRPLPPRRKQIYDK
jgi:hypothetical protein